MIIDGLYDAADLWAMESEALAELGLTRDPSKASKGKTPAWIEAVGRHLWTCWMLDKTDSRILNYIIPPMQLRLARMLHVSQYPRMDAQEAYNTLWLGMVSALPRYDSSKGTLFSYILTIATYRIYDLAKPKQDPTVGIEEADYELVCDQSAHQLADFIGYVEKLKQISGKTDNRILDALLTVIAHSQINCPTQKTIIAAVSRLSKLPEMMVSRYYLQVLERYQHDVLD